MFLYISKALKGDGKGQKEKPIIISTWAMVDRFGTNGVRAESAE